MPKKTGKEFIWTDEEAELLLNVAIEYKTKKAAECVDWESVKSKYSDIHKEFLAALPADNGEDSFNEFPHNKEQITKQVVASKLKAVRVKFRQAVDSGRRSGHGRVVLLYYELCEQVWGGSPATEQLEGGLESADLGNDTTRMANSSSNTQDDSQVETQDFGNNLGDVNDSDRDVDNSEDNGDVSRSNDDNEQSLATQQDSSSVNHDGEACVSKVQKRRQFLDGKLDNYRQEKLKRKVPLDAQLLSCAQEELAVKKRLVEQIGQMDKQYAENMTRMSQSMEKLSGSIAEGFSLLKTVMLQTAGPSYPPPPSHYHQFYPGPHSTYSFPSSSSYHGSSTGSNSCPQSPQYDLGGMWEGDV